MNKLLLAHTAGRLSVVSDFGRHVPEGCGGRLVYALRAHL